MEAKRKSIIFIVVGIVLLVAAIGLIFYLNSFKGINDLKNIDQSKFAPIQSRADKPILYIKNDSLFSKAADGTGDAVNISGGALCANDIVESPSSYFDIVKQSKNGDTTYFMKNYSKSLYKGDLYATTDYKTSFMVDENIFIEPYYEYLKLSNDGKTSLYMKNLVVGENELFGDLCYSKIENGTVSKATIAEGIYCSTTSNGIQTSYVMSPNGKYVACYSEYNAEKQVGGLIIAEVGATAKPMFLENIAALNLISITDDGFLTFSQSKLDPATEAILKNVCVINYSDMKVTEFGTKVEPSGIFVAENSDKFVYIDIVDEKIHAYSVSCSTLKKTLISDNYFGFTSLDPKNECYIFAYSEDINSSESTQKIYIKTPELEKPELLCENILLPKHVKASIDYKTIYYMANYNDAEKSGELFKITLNDGKLSSPTKVSDKVFDFAVSQGGKVVVLQTDFNSENKTVNIKKYISGKLELVKENIKLDNISLSVDAEALVYASNLTQKFDAELTYVSLSNDKISTIDQNADFTLFYYDNYLNSNLESPSNNIRNKYHVRGKNNILFYKNVDETCTFGELYLFNGKENILIDKDVVVLPLE